ncbi:GDSL-like Lipase/Acylhydrolase family protein [Amycolatopsis marina]|uniref:GDSL-like Lipase/Acylhydrolase family protein n=1 Tax=Amycolatopsis marina TaxID=490629 RepID=A0A1I1CEB2_9PSEU|nr:SGNH/GDSL hydrolase family protein [Amycolatopsis marina]SFB61025.1 GDSL-like Lipase/Acylhydrolase family protein [Amycolatopsis marina]
MTTRSRRSSLPRRLFVALVAVVTAVTLAAPPATAGSNHWVGTWGTSVQAPGPDGFSGPNWSREGFTDQSVRQVIRVSAGGLRLRVRLSNEYGSAPLRLTGASIGKAGAGASVRPGSVRPLTFEHSLSATIPAGEQLASDPVLLPTAPLETLSVTLYFAEPTGPSTFHEQAVATTYRAAGDHRFDRGAAAFTESTKSWYHLAGVDVAGQVFGARGTVVTLGDSITDGVASTVDTNNRYPDELAERLVAARKPLGVLNAGISGNRVLRDSPCFGEAALDRFERDVLEQPGVRTVIVLEGINDIGMGGPGFGDCAPPSPEVTAADLIEGHRALIEAARAAGIKTVGATLLPMKGSFYDDPEDKAEAVRDEVNDWIRSSGEYDEVVDLGRALADRRIVLVHHRCRRALECGSRWTPV